MLLDPDEEGVFGELGVFFAVEVGLGPYDVLTTLEPPLFEQLPRLLQVLRPCPQENKRRRIRDLSHFDPFQLFQRHRCLDPSLP